MRSRLAPSSVLLAGLTLAGCSFQGGVTVSAPAPTTTTSTPAPTTAPPGPTSAPPPSGSTPTTSGPTSTAPATSGGSPTTVAESSGPSTEPPGPVTACRTGNLSAALLPAAGTTADTAGSATISLTNLGPSACRLRGFGGIALSRSDGTPVLATQQRTDATTTSVLLPRGGVATSAISWSRTANTAVGEPTTGDCEPVPTSLLIIPPNEVAELAVPWSSGPVCDQGTITQSPYTAG